jgi:hypothetical protein
MMGSLRAQLIDWIRSLALITFTHEHALVQWLYRKV